MRTVSICCHHSVASLIADEDVCETHFNRVHNQVFFTLLRLRIICGITGCP